MIGFVITGVLLVLVGAVLWEVGVGFKGRSELSRARHNVAEKQREVDTLRYWLQIAGTRYMDAQLELESLEERLDELVAISEHGKSPPSAEPDGPDTDAATCGASTSTSASPTR